MADALDRIADDIHAQPAMCNVAYDVSKLEGERLGDYPRVIWISDGGTFPPTDNVGGRLQTAPALRARQIRTDAMEVFLHIWGEDREATRAIMHNLLATCWARLGGSVDFIGYKWATQQEARGEFATHGEKILMTLTIQIPVHEQQILTTNVATQTHRGDFIDNATGATTSGICQT